MKWIFLVFSAILMTVSSCKKNTDGNQIPIDSVVYVQMAEMPDSNGGKPSLIFGCYTGNFFNSGMGLDYEAATKNNNITIYFTNISRPQSATFDGCNCPATANINLGVLNTGIYTLNIVINGSTHSGRFIVSDSNYVVSLAATHNVSFIYNSLGRLPANTVFGSVNGKSAVPTGTINAVIDSLVSFGAVPFTGSTGNYDLNGIPFTVYPGDSINIPDYYSTYGRQFIYTYTGDYNKIISLLKNYPNNDTTTVSLMSDIKN